MIFKNFKDHADSILEACNYKLSFLEKSENKTISELATELSKYLDDERKLIEDKSDFINYRNLCTGIMELAALIIPSTKADSKWLYPLIIECYSILDIKIQDREILISQYPEKMIADTSEGFAVIFDIMKTYKGRIPDEITLKTVDLFIVPSEAQFDFSSLAILGHELGHALWKLHYKEFIKQITTSYFEKYLKENDLTSLDVFEKEDVETRFLSHIQEYFCDEIGRKIFGIVFDIATVKILGLYDMPPSRKYPSSKSRVEISRNNLEDFIKNQENKTFHNSIERFLSDFKLNGKSTDKKKESLLNVVDQIFSGFSEINHPIISRKVNLKNIWDNVSAELNSFRPPIEVVSDIEPELIPAIHILIGTVLYYYNNDNLIKNNEYFINSNENEQNKYTKIKSILKEHLMYAIGLNKFVKNCREKISIDYSSLKKSLWIMRNRYSGGVNNSFTVVPSIHPNSQYGQNSVDLRLGQYFLVHKPSKYKYISPEPNKNINIESFYERIFQPPKNEFVLHPHQFVLASTMEYISLPLDYFALIIGRSSWGRLGLNIATATAVQSGYRGCITLELRNLGETPLPLRVGIRIAQICLIRTPAESTPEGYYSRKDNKYIGPIKCEIPKLDMDKDWDLLLD